MRRALSTFPTSWLRHWKRRFDAMPEFAFYVRALRDFRYEVENELLARDLPALAEQSGGFPCISVGGWN